MERKVTWIYQPGFLPPTEQFIKGPTTKSFKRAENRGQESNSLSLSEPVCHSVADVEPGRLHGPESYEPMRSPRRPPACLSWFQHTNVLLCPGGDFFKTRRLSGEW